MNESALNQESDEVISDPKLLGLPRPLVGALIGILVFLLLFSIAWFTEWNYLVYVVFSPYYILTLFFSRFMFSLSPFEDRILPFLTSGISPALIGSLMISKKRRKKTNGVTFFWIYLFISLALGFFILVISGLFN